MPEKGIINSMKKFLCIWFILILLAALLTEGAAEIWKGSGEAGGNFSRVPGVLRTGGSPDEGISRKQDGNREMLTAKSRKKKKTTATPKVTAAPTPDAAPDGDGNREAPAATPVPEGPITDPRSIADWLFSHDMQLPENFITKKEAMALGWGTRYRNVSDAAPGKSIGGDYFGNYEGKLPTGKGISYREADCYYTKGSRNAFRVIYSSHGRVWYTEDHYNTFEELFPTGP